MDDDIKVTRLIFNCEEAVLSEGIPSGSFIWKSCYYLEILLLVFLLGGLYGNLVIIWKYYLFMDFL